MSSTKKLKASDRQAISRKLMTVLKKKYGGSLPKSSRPALETLLFAACLENASYEVAQRAFQHMLDSFHDLNEIRVSSITEIEQVIADLPEPDWKALRIRETLQHTFEKHYSFDLDALKRKTMDGAIKQLSEIRYLTPFMRTYVLQSSLGSHVVPIDDASREVLVWAGLVDVGGTAETASDEMKSGLKKQDSPLFVHLLRAVATDPKYIGTFAPPKPDDEIDPAAAPERLKQHLAKPPRRPAKKKATKVRKKRAAKPKTSTKKTPSRRTGTSKVTKKVSRPKKKTTKRRVKHK